MKTLTIQDYTAMPGPVRDELHAWLDTEGLWGPFGPSVHTLDFDGTAVTLHCFARDEFGKLYLDPATGRAAQAKPLLHECKGPPPRVVIEACGKATR